MNGRPASYRTRPGRQPKYRCNTYNPVAIVGKSPFQQQPKFRYQSSKPTAWPGTQSNLTIWFISHFKSLTQSVIPTQSRCNPEIYQQLVNERPAIYRTRSGQAGRASTYCDRISGLHSPITGHFRQQRQRMHRPTMSTQS